jgi:hypothetical protein
MRIDNRAFEILIQEERSGKLRAENAQQVKKPEESSDWNGPSNEKRFSKFEQIPSNLRSNPRQSNGSINNPRNSDAGNFFNDGDFDFNSDNNNNNRNMRNLQNRPNTNEQSINSFSNFSEFTNKFSNSNVNSNTSSVNTVPRGSYTNNTNQRSNTNPVSHQNQGLLVDFNDIVPEKRKVTDNKELLNQINFDIGGHVANNSSENNFDVFNHNKNVLSNISLPNVNDDFGGIPNTFSSSGNSFGNPISNTNTNNFNNIQNTQNVQQAGNFNNINMSNNGFSGSQNVQNMGNVNVNFFDSTNNNNNLSNTNPQNRYNNVNVGSSNNFYSPMSNNKDFTVGESSSGQNTTNNFSVETGVGNNSSSGNNENTNDFKVNKEEII